jgi:hypothetical protein
MRHSRIETSLQAHGSPPAQSCLQEKLVTFLCPQQNLVILDPAVSPCAGFEQLTYRFAASWRELLGVLTARAG